MTKIESETTRNHEGETLDVAIVGAGFAGIYMLYRARKMGLRARVFERGTGIGGTWFWNRYPGARCDIESLEYSYQFSDELAQDWEWSEHYATQPEILRYVNHVADRFELRDGIQLETTVEAATWDDASALWSVRTDRGTVRARFCVMATGCLSVANRPTFAGLDRFRGDWYHTGDWPQDGVDFRGKRVAVIGTGSSGVQSIPVIAAEAARLTVFQRTANYSVPARNRPMSEERQRDVKSRYRAFRAANSKTNSGFGSDYPANEAEAANTDEAERLRVYEERWQRGGLTFLGSFSDLMLSEQSNETAASFVKAKIAEVVKDPAVAEILTPTQVIGCKRLCADDGYYETFNRPNVSLVDISATPIEEITERGVRVGRLARGDHEYGGQEYGGQEYGGQEYRGQEYRGQEYEVDVIVFAIGFDAMTGALARIDLRGRGGVALKDKWAEGPRTYLGLGVAEFPNLFTVTGPGSPSVLSNMLPSIEQHVDWIADCIAYLDAGGFRSIEASTEAEDAWVAHVNELVGDTLYSQCNSWYLGANVPGKPRVFMPCLGYADYVAKCEEVVANDYAGFVLTPA